MCIESANRQLSAGTVQHLPEVGGVGKPTDSPRDAGGTDTSVLLSRLQHKIQ